MKRSRDVQTRRKIESQLDSLTGHQHATSHRDIRWINSARPLHQPTILTYYNIYLIFMRFKCQFLVYKRSITCLYDVVEQHVCFAFMSYGWKYLKFSTHYAYSFHHPLKHYAHRHP